MGKHSRNFIPPTLGHTRARLGVRTHHCSYEPEPMPWLLMGEDFDDIDEALNYDPRWDDDDDDPGSHRRGARV